MICALREVKDLSSKTKSLYSHALSLTPVSPPNDLQKQTYLQHELPCLYRCKSYTLISSAHLFSTRALAPTELLFVVASECATVVFHNRRRISDDFFGQFEKVEAEGGRHSLKKKTQIEGEASSKSKKKKTGKKAGNKKPHPNMPKSPANQKMHDVGAASPCAPHPMSPTAGDAVDPFFACPPTQTQTTSQSNKSKPDSTGTTPPPKAGNGYEDFLPLALRNKQNQ
uniref:Uncharacterized protein n=1 Tax=Steinernema glaseri TaxID=37863 RepID=A0A1I8AMI7_9BILA